MAGLPQWFTIDTPQNGLPQWFVIDKPQSKWQKFLSWVKDFWEWLVSFAWWLPKVVAETWIVDKPASWLAGKIGNPIREALGKPALTNEQLSQQKFSDMAKGSQVWGDPESKLAKTTTTVMDTAALLTAIPWIIKWWVKLAWIKALKEAIKKWEVTEQAIKKWWAGWILDMIREWSNKVNKISALPRWWIKEQWALARRWSWVDDVVKPSQKTLDSVATITEEIPKSKNMWVQTLYTNISNTISSLSDWLSWKLKNIKIRSQTAKLKWLTDALDDLYDETIEYSKPTANAISKAKDAIVNATNADEAWEAAKKLDKLIPDSIKNGVANGWKDALVYGRRRGARWAFNDYLDDVASWIDDVDVKKTFKKISDLYRWKWWIEENILLTTKKVTGMKDTIKSVAKKSAMWVVWLAAIKGLLSWWKPPTPSEYIPQ